MSLFDTYNRSDADAGCIGNLLLCDAVIGSYVV